MIQFFRKIRQNLLLEGQTGKYLKYALGEIVLVVIGILIALQINNLNENSKQKRQANNYKQTLITELKVDLMSLDQLDTLCRKMQGDINDYISYFKKPDKEIGVVIQEMDKVTYYGDFYQSRAYTIDDIINTGNLELFSKEIKHAILELKATQEFYEKNREEVVQHWVLSNLEFENAVDMLSFYDLSDVEAKNLNDWRLDLKSDQYRLFNNRALSLLRTYYFRTDQNHKMKQSIEKLLTELEQE
ncbi:DUF6090 family protein [Reichenbachiella ulvae]|uniref:DUF6090 family protein n=1 Tax=Reichenbachiella ulvae TaxID=2980104 RepID=A0ABT3CR59_9BACT|nr:DUF6090 family protein [Reichenbachiella ulvae]MCV9386181.1 DUF6090 family protein [Reichenbachiella ulvae]